MPIVATSFNVAGEDPEIEISLNMNRIENKVDIIVDEGRAKIGSASTIIKIKGEEVFLLREGPISIEDIKKKLNLRKEE